MLRAYIDSTDDALFVLCDEMKFLLCNHAGENYFGVKEEVLIKHNQRLPITELFNDEITRQIFLTEYPKVLAGDTARFETFMEPSQAESHWIEFNLNRVDIEDAPMVIIVARNIDSRKQLESDMNNQKAKLESLVNDRTEELRLANQQKDKLFSIIAHDMRTPFTPILGYAETIINHADTLPAKQIRDYATKIHNSGKYSLNLLSDLLEWSRLQLDSVTVKKIHFDLKDVTRNAINQLSSYADNKQVTLINNVPNTHAEIDRHIIETVIRNLVNNAIKFTPAGGMVNVDIRNHDNHLTITVTDTGTGIEASKLKQIISSNSYESTPGTEHEEGTGLGIPLCQSLLQKHDSILCAESEHGRGSCFYFTL